MLRDTGAHFGSGCGGLSVVGVLAVQPELPQPDLSHRLSRTRQSIPFVLGGRKVDLHIGETFSDAGAITVPVRTGADTCRLHLSPALVAWLQQPLDLEGALIDEEPPQRALLLEFAGLDLLQVLESQLGEDIRLGEDGNGEVSHALDLAIAAGDEMMPLRLELPSRLAHALADYLDDIQPPAPADLSGFSAELVIEAGSQDISRDELESLRPGDVVMLSNHRPVVVIDGKLVAPIRRQADGAELDGPFYPKARRAMVGSLSTVDDAEPGTHIVNLAAEFARATMTLGEIDALKLRQPLPLSYFDETGVDIVIDNHRIGRGELLMVGAGMGMRIVHLLPSAPVQSIQTS